jgi:excisionase family DNA binding protein
MTELMNTKEAAAYLGIHEKKVYALAKAGKVPCTRVTGKWVFPRKLIDQWIEESAGARGRMPKEEQRPFLLAAGSDDPSLGILRECYAQRVAPTRLFLATVGSSGGLDALRDGVADLALAHLRHPETGEYNVPYLESAFHSGVAVVPLFHRELGLVTRSGNPFGLRSLADLTRASLRFVNRQDGSGTRIFFDQELARLDIDPERITGYEAAVPTHLEVGLQILRGEADVGLATHAAARLLNLDFIPLTRERFDILVPKERFFSRAIQVLLEVAGSREFRTRLDAQGGYDTSESGRILSSP